VEEKMTKEKLIDLLQTNREAFDAIINQVPHARMTEPLAPGEWSVKDTIAHLTYYERWLGDRMHEQLTGTPYQPTELDGKPEQEFNQIVYETHKEQPLAEVLAESQMAYESLMQAVRLHSEAFLVEPQQFKEGPDPIIVWHSLSGNVYEHYLEHIEIIQNWLDQNN